MYSGQFVLSQIMRSTSEYYFQKCVAKYDGDNYVRYFSCWQQFQTLAFGQLTFCESLRDIVCSLEPHSKKLYHLGFTDMVRRSTLAEANEYRDYRIFEEFGYFLIKKATKLYHDDSIFLDDVNSIAYGLDSSTVDLCLNVFPWARFRKKKGAIKIHTLLDLGNSMPVFVRITEGSEHDVNILDEIDIEPNAFYVMNRAYIDYKRLYSIHNEKGYFVVMAKSNLKFRRLYSRPIDKSIGLRCDQTIVLTGAKSKTRYPEQLRRIKYYDKEHDRHLIFLTNNFNVKAENIAALYKSRWQIELFFKWIKGNLRVKKFWGRSRNAVKIQIWVAICTYLIIAIIRKELHLEKPMSEILQILRISPFDRIPLDKLLSDDYSHYSKPSIDFQANLFDF